MLVASWRAVRATPGMPFRFASEGCFWHTMHILISQLDSKPAAGADLRCVVSALRSRSSSFDSAAGRGASGDADAVKAQLLDAALLHVPQLARADTAPPLFTVQIYSGDLHWPTS